MPILKDCSSKPTCEVEINLVVVNSSSVRFGIYFRTGPAFPEVHMEIACLKKDFLKLLDDLKQIDNTHLSMLEMHDPGLCIYHIPQFGQYYYPEYGIYQVSESERNEFEPLYKLIFSLDANEKNRFGPSECGLALCLVVKLEQIIEFVDSIKSEIYNF
ncbi:hypothetical protein [Lysinibacillus antri]|uniref:Uncharacterized protein n=1 Tax=Lysinibacillus antri TaxID=2498145 RepID=A0A3S0R656_9BACI|nr:hypothetical protein [Lysinibacillus antri]RUL52129.1 hypothetical protein EK386_09750 [Lysinibacillus antri]